MAGDDKQFGEVSLPAGSYDSDKLAAGFAAAAKAKDEDRQGLVNKAIDDASGGETSRPDGQVLPDHVVVEVDNGLGGKENIQVYAPKLADQHEEGAQPILPSDKGDVEKGNKAAIAEAVKGAEPAPEPVEVAAAPPASPAPASASSAAGNTETK